MKTTLLFIFIFLLFANTLSIGSPKKDDNNSNVCFKQRFNYVVETNLPAKMFFEVFCSRLISKYNWLKVSTDIGEDDTFRSLFNFTDETEHSWICEVKIRKVEMNKISVEINVGYLES